MSKAKRNMGSPVGLAKETLPAHGRPSGGGAIAAWRENRHPLSHAADAPCTKSRCFVHRNARPFCIYQSSAHRLSLRTTADVQARSSSALRRRFRNLRRSLSVALGKELLRLRGNELFPIAIAVLSGFVIGALVALLTEAVLLLHHLLFGAPLNSHLSGDIEIPVFVKIRRTRRRRRSDQLPLSLAARSHRQMRDISHTRSLFLQARPTLMTPM